MFATATDMNKYNYLLEMKILDNPNNAQIVRIHLFEFF